MHILIIGSNGQVGYELVQTCKKLDFSFDATNRSDLDLTNLESIKSFFIKNNNYDFVINAAAYTQVDKAEDEPELVDLVNNQSLSVISDMCKQYDIPLLHISTDYVFDGKKTTLYNELDVTKPCGSYGLSKLKGEQQVQKWEKHLILRVSWVFGRHGNNFVKTISRLSKYKDRLEIIADQYGGPTPARAIAYSALDMIKKIIQNGSENLYGTYNYSGYPLTTWHQLAQYVINNTEGSVAKSLIPLQTHEYPLKADRPSNSGLNCNKIFKKFGIQQPVWLNYIKETINYIEE